MSQQPKALELAHRLATRRVTNWVHATGDTPKSNGFRPDHECAEAASILRTQHAELEDLRALLRTQRTVINDQQTELDRKSDAIQRLWAERDALRKEVERLNLELDAQRLYARALCKAVDTATDFAGTVAGGSSWWDDVWAEQAAALDRARDRITIAAQGVKG